MARIVLVDDNEYLRGLLRRCLEAAGHEVIEGGDGVAGSRLYREHSPDVLVCDLYMPHKDGLELIRELRQAGTPIIAISGEGPARVASLLPIARALGALRVLYKPFDGDALLEAVREVLQEQRCPPAPGS